LGPSSYLINFKFSGIINKAEIRYIIESKTLLLDSGSSKTNDPPSQIRVKDYT